MPLAQIRLLVERDLRELERDAHEVFEALVVPALGRDELVQRRALLGFTMSCFAFVDVLSKLDDSGRQTPRMRKFITDRMRLDRTAAAVSVEAWRHHLMHTGNPPEVIEDTTTRQRYDWVAWWGGSESSTGLQVEAGNPDDGHSYVFLLMPFLKSLRKTAAEFFDQVERDAELTTKVQARWHNLRSTEIDI